jgi:hypothetical protein
MVRLPGLPIEENRTKTRSLGLYLRLVLDTRCGWLPAYLNGRVLKRRPSKLLND